ncbi:unnamed protein product [Durusdinium trenchii]|uniref:Uncharacterized protein n=2 Tax=Durusdinium trenchii TaxID=1381693 RepID=A0ABP0QN06_9DINO
MESSTDEEQLLPPHQLKVKAYSRWWPAVAALGCSALVLRSVLNTDTAKDVRQLETSGGIFYSSNGQTEVHFELSRQRISAADIEQIWPGINVHFDEGTGTVTSQSLSDYTAQLLSEPSPFGGQQGAVKIPAGQSSSDQLDWGQYVVYTRKQVCYIAALIASGNEAADYHSGLSQLIPPDKCTTGDLYQAGFNRALLGLLAACSVDPTLADGGQGPVLIVAKSTDDLSKAPSLDNSGVPLADVPLRTCRFRDGSTGNPPLSDIPQTPQEACNDDDSFPVDFMRSGNSLKGQVMVDITAAWIGGYILAHKGCGGFDGGQDERLMTTMPEVMVLSFFMSQEASPIASEGVSLLVPAYVIGARRIFANFDGTSRDIGPAFNQGNPVVNLAVPMTSDLVPVQIGGQSAQMSAMSPFLGFQSINQQAGLANDVPPCRLNQNPIQFQTSGDYGFENQVKAWYNAVSLQFWHPDVQVILKSMAKSIGSGPWGSGVWWGNSQIFALVAWMGQALAQQSWDQAPFLDYYIYSSFTENPSNQCLIHAREDCIKCLQSCDDAFAGPGTTQRYCCMEPQPWIPSSGLFPQTNDGKPCIPTDLHEQICGENGFAHVYDHFKGSTVGELWNAVKTAAATVEADPTATTLFDAMLR